MLKKSGIPHHLANMERYSGSGIVEGGGIVGVV